MASELEMGLALQLLEKTRTRVQAKTFETAVDEVLTQAD